MSSPTFGVFCFPVTVFCLSHDHLPLDPRTASISPRLTAPLTSLRICLPPSEAPTPRNSRSQPGRTSADRRGSRCCPARASSSRLPSNSWSRSLSSVMVTSGRVHHYVHRHQMTERTRVLSAHERSASKGSSKYVAKPAVFTLVTHGRLTSASKFSIEPICRIFDVTAENDRASLNVKSPTVGSLLCVSSTRDSHVRVRVSTHSILKC